MHSAPLVAIEQQQQIVNQPMCRSFNGATSLFRCCWGDDGLRRVGECGGGVTWVRSGKDVTATITGVAGDHDRRSMSVSEYSTHTHTHTQLQIHHYKHHKVITTIDDRAARRSHILYSIYVHSFGASAKAVRLLIVIMLVYYTPEHKDISASCSIVRMVVKRDSQLSPDRCWWVW